MSLITNELKDLVINVDEAERLCRYIGITVKDFAEFVNEVFNSDNVTSEKLETEDFLLMGDFEVSAVSSDKKNALAVGVFPKKELEQDGPYKMAAFLVFKADFFENGDPLYEKFSKDLELSDGEYPFVYISKVNEKFSYVTSEELCETKIPFTWFEDNEIPELFPRNNEYESLLLMNFGEKNNVG